MRLSGVLLLIVFFAGCNKEKLKTPAAYFIQTGQVNVKTNVYTEGAASHKITDLGVYVNEIFKGFYPVGSALPITASGQAQVQIYPVIKNNGISDTRQPYEFYERIVIDTNVASGVVVPRNLTFRYKTSAKFHYIESFSGGTSGVGIKYSPGSDLATFDVNNDLNSFDGGYMHFVLHDDYRNAYFETTSLYVLPGNGAPVYLEMNYRCNQPFTVGTFNGSDYRALITVNRSDTWNKIYVQLTAGVTTPPTYPAYGIFIRAIRTDDTPQAEFFIDNLKIISY